MVCKATYIKNKKIETSKSNHIKDFEDIGKAPWDLIFSIYEAGWDSLVADNHRNSFRQKFSYKFTPCISPEKHGKKQETLATKSLSIERLPPPIPAKSPKKIKEILKYFKSKPPLTTPNHTKSYAQLARNISNTEEVLKIKAAFPSVKVTNIDNIQKIIKGDKNPKTKLQINMTTKGPSCKQVIVLMSEINQKNLIKESGTYIANLNRALKSIKSDISVDFICPDVSSIIVVTNKVTNPSDLQTIEHYIKSTCQN